MGCECECVSVWSQWEARWHCCLFVDEAEAARGGARPWAGGVPLGPWARALQRRRYLGRKAGPVGGRRAELGLPGGRPFLHSSHSLASAAWSPLQLPLNCRPPAPADGTPGPSIPSAALKGTVPRGPPACPSPWGGEALQPHPGLPRLPPAPREGATRSGCGEATPQHRLLPPSPSLTEPQANGHFSCFSCETDVGGWD